MTKRREQARADRKEKILFIIGKLITIVQIVMSATPCSVMMILTSCSVWSMCETIGTIAEILPSLATDGQVKMMNGIGGSGDFTRNAYISIFTCPSVAVHHLGSADVRGVHVAVDVGCDGSVDGDDTESAHHFRAVRDFRRTEHQFVAEEVHF